MQHDGAARPRAPQHKVVGLDITIADGLRVAVAQKLQHTLDDGGGLKLRQLALVRLHVTGFFGVCVWVHQRMRSTASAQPQWGVHALRLCCARRGAR
jgi:hypothetical protein